MIRPAQQYHQPSSWNAQSDNSTRELEKLHASANDLLGLSFSSPQPIHAPTLTRSISNTSVPSSKPVAIPSSTGMSTRKSTRRESVGSVEKKKGGYINRRESFGTRSGRVNSTIVDHRLATSNTTPPPMPSLSTSATSAYSSAPGSGLLSPSSLPPPTIILQPGDAEDGEILEYDMNERNEKGGKRRSGSVFRCESCSKVYRHPSCLVKHRWQHSPHWQEASNLRLSKHQQVQVLEAATILTHLHPEAGTSLPEDKSLWPAAVAPDAHPMPSISYGASRQRSKATSTHPSRLANPNTFQRRRDSATPAPSDSPMSRSSTTPAPSFRATSVAAGSPVDSQQQPRQAEEGDDEEDEESNNEEESSPEPDVSSSYGNVHGLALGGRPKLTSSISVGPDYGIPSMLYSSSYHSASYQPSLLSRSYSSSSAQPSMPISFPRRESMTSSTLASFNNMGLTSPPSNATPPSLYSSSPVPHAGSHHLGSSLGGHSHHSQSFVNSFGGGGGINSPYGTSPGLPRSSIRGGAVEEEEEEEEHDAVGQRYASGSGSDERGSPPGGRAGDDEDEMMDMEM